LCIAYVLAAGDALLDPAARLLKRHLTVERIPDGFRYARYT
jgi:hypothetical protein